MLRRNWQELIKPHKFNLMHHDDTHRSGVLVVEPLERGFGVTLGNSLRRVLLSSLQGAAVTAVQIEGVLHEFSSLPGVKEDVTDIILNLKSLSVRSHAVTPRKLRLVAQGPRVVTAGLLEGHADVEVFDPAHVICTLDDGARISMDLTVEVGKGYLPASQRVVECLPIGLILLDSNFTPVKRVSYKVENTRVGQVTDYDKLSIEVETNGFVKPEDAIGLAARILQDQFQKFVNFDELVDQVAVVPEAQTVPLPFPLDLLRRLEDFDLSLRSTNCFKSSNLLYLGDLVSLTEAQLLRMPNFGRKSLDEIKGLLQPMGLTLGMDFPWPPENIEQLIKSLEAFQVS